MTLTRAKYRISCSCRYFYIKLNPGNLILQALENGVYVVGSCGFDSIPSDLGQACLGNIQISLNNIFVNQFF
jgi:hypothetical protein